LFPRESSGAKAMDDTSTTTADEHFAF
jgi:hypothetical protein